MAESSRTALFIDAAYLEKVCFGAFADQQGGKRVPLKLDFKRLAGVLAGEKTWRVYYYYAMPFRSDPPLPAEQAAFTAKKSFIEFLSRQPRWVLREGVVERRGDERRGEIFLQKRTDVMLAVDLVRLAWRGEITRAVIVAGDSDFVPAIADARAAGVHVKLRYEGSTVHQDLLAAANEAQPLTRQELGAAKL